MNIKDEIKQFSEPDDQPILLWLFDKYHWESQWTFVAECIFIKYGAMSYETNRIWRPKEDGRILYYHHKLQELMTNERKASKET